MFKKEFLVYSRSTINQRLDVFLSEKIKDLSRSQLQRLVDKESVKVNGEFKKSSYKLKAGDRIEIEFELPGPLEIQAEDIALEMLYSDGHLVVINKPSGMVVHPGAGIRCGTLVNALLFHFPDVKNIGPEERPGIVHRLDKEASGVMVVARSEKAYRELQRQFRKREVGKVYMGLVWGRMKDKEGRIDWPIGRHPKLGQRISVKTKKPKSAETHYSVLKEFQDSTLLEIKPITGRTHQIRVHFSAAGHPLVGDKRYGIRMSKIKFPRLFLHAYRLEFNHPETGKRMEFHSPLPEELKKILEYFGLVIMKRNNTSDE